MTPKEALKKFWFLVWKDNSIKGWLISLVFLFIVIKFIFFPLMSFVTGTSLPLAIVESCSMYHDKSFFSSFSPWMERHADKYSNLNISSSEFSSFSLRRGFNKGDILLITRANPQSLKVGDTIIFDAGQTNPIIHRIIKISETNGKRTFSTEGDNNNGQISFEKKISEEQLIGKARFVVAPYLGWVKLIFYDWQKPQEERGFCSEN